MRRHTLSLGAHPGHPLASFFLVSPIHGASHDFFPRQGKKRVAWALRQPFRQAFDFFLYIRQAISSIRPFRSSATPHRCGRDTAVLLLPPPGSHDNHFTPTP